MTEIHDHVVQIVCSYLSNNQLPVEKIPQLIREVQAVFDGKPEANGLVPPIPIEESVGEDFIICLEDGKRMKMLKRYLAVNFDMTPEEYREKWGLPDDYPMVCHNYSKQRQEIAVGMGLGKTKTPEFSSER